MDDLIRDFVTETVESLDSVEGELLLCAQKGLDGDLRTRVGRVLHTLKGTCGFLDLPRLEALAHHAEDQLEQAGDEASIDGLLDSFNQIRARLTLIGLHGAETSDPEATIAGDIAGLETTARDGAHISGEQLERLLADLSELVVVRNQLQAVSHQIDAPSLRAPLQHLSQVVGTLEEQVSRATMQKIGRAWRLIPRVVRTMSGEQNKLIHVSMSGGDLEIDRGLFAVVRNSLVHLVRNAVVHGIETAGDRLAQGKTAEGSIHITAAQQDGHVVLTIRDDGRGLTEPLTARAGREVTLLSGRGVGLEAVRADVEAFGGQFSFTSAAGMGMVFTLKLPLMIAILPCLIVSAAGQSFALAQEAVREIVRMAPHLMTEEGHLRCRLGEVPVLCLAQSLGLAAGRTGEAFAVVCEFAGKRFAVLAEAVLDRENLSLKRLLLQGGEQAFAGAAIAPDGSVLLVLEPTFLAAQVQQSVELMTEPEPPQDHTSAKGLEFSTGDGKRRLVPIRALQRIAFLPAGGENTGDVPTIVLGHGAPVASSGRRPVLVVSNGVQDIGLAVDGIGELLPLPDMTDETDFVEPGYRAGQTGDGQPLDILDVDALLSHHGMAAPRSGIALLEPDPFCRSYLLGWLAAYGANGFDPAQQTAAQQLQQHRPAIVLADLDRPETAEVLAKLGFGAGQTPVVIGLASRRDAAVMDRAQRILAMLVIGKFDRVALRAALHDVAGGIAA